MKSIFKISLFSIFVFGLSACDKGYQIRFSNLYKESIDSLSIGNDKIVFTNIGLETYTEYKPISRGQYTAKCVSKSKHRNSTSFFISGKGSGTKTVQIDATGRMTFLEE